MRRPFISNPFCVDCFIDIISLLLKLVTSGLIPFADDDIEPQRAKVHKVTYQGKSGEGISTQVPDCSPLLTRSWSATFSIWSPHIDTLEKRPTAYFSQDRDISQDALLSVQKLEKVLGKPGPLSSLDLGNQSIHLASKHKQLFIQLK